MPISGLVITLANPAEADNVARVLQQAEPRLEFGTAQGNQLPCVLEATDARDGEAVHAWLLRQTGIVNVDVVFAEVDEKSA